MGKFTPNRRWLALSISVALSLAATSASQAQTAAASPTQSIRLEGAANFRDIGGYVTRDGRRVKRGLLFRSNALNTLTEEDKRTLATLDPAVIVDFRSPAEYGPAPDQLPAAWRVTVDFAAPISASASSSGLAMRLSA